MAGEIGISRKGVEWQITKFKQAGELERVGPTKGGLWIIVGEKDE